jgi:hypothetical protein
MAYLGRQPLVGNYQVLDAIVATTTDTYALTKDMVLLQYSHKLHLTVSYR